MILIQIHTCITRQPQYAQGTGAQHAKGRCDASQTQTVAESAVPRSRSSLTVAAAVPSRQLDKDLSKEPMCGVVAVAHVAGVPAAAAFAAFKEALSKTGGWRGRTTDAERRAMLARLQVEFASLDPPRHPRAGRRGRPKKRAPRYMQLLEWTESHAEQGVTYIVATSRHCQVVRDGNVTDQRGTRAVQDFWGRRKHIQTILKIEGGSGDR